MPLIQPISPQKTSLTLPRIEDATRHQDKRDASFTTASPDVALNITDQFITPAAPSSAVQMQIKALISEQAESFEANKAKDDES